MTTEDDPPRSSLLIFSAKSLVLLSRDMGYKQSYWDCQTMGLWEEGQDNV